ncbi:MAG: T9SS type A sorting domain-containing protein [Bacteroidia bacterium]
MIKNLTRQVLLLGTFAFSLSSFAQIQLSADDILHIGIYETNIDVLDSMELGDAAPNQMWDFSSLQVQVPLQFEIRANQSNNSNDPSNLVRISNFDTFKHFYKTNSEISSIQTLQNIDTFVFMKLREYSVPMSYMQENRDSYTVIFDHAGSTIGLPYDSIRIRIKVNVNSIADAWGQIKLPDMNADALRVHSSSRFYVTLEGKTGNGPFTLLPDYTEDDQTEEYIWFGKDKGSYLAKYDVESNQMEYLESYTLSVESKQVFSDLILPNPAHGMWNIQNTGEHTFHLHLYDMQGKLQWKSVLDANASQELDIHNLNTGIYILQLRDLKTNVSTTKKILTN